MKIDLEQSIQQNVNSEKCFFKCDKPNGSMLIGIITLFLGITLLPIFIQMMEGSLPVTLNDFLQGLFNEFARFLNYTLSLKMTDYVLYMTFSLIAGILTIKPWKSIGVPLAFLGINMLGFFFMSLFYLGITIDYDLFFSGILPSLLTFAITVLAPCLGGTMISSIIISKKNCFVMGKGTIVSS